MEQAGAAEQWVTRAEGAVEVARLERAANALARADHPGVVEHVSFTMTGLESAELRTIRVAAPSLAALALPPAELAGVVAAVASTLADLHASDVVHGAVEACHVLVPPGGRPRLCGFSGDAAATPADDVAALGRMLEASTAKATSAEVDALESLRARPRTFLGLPRRPPAGAHRHGSAGGQGASRALRALREIAHLATEEEESRRPTAEAIAALIRDRVPGAAFPRTHEAGSDNDMLTRGRPARWTARRLLLALGPIAALGVAVFVAGAVIPSGASSDVEPVPRRASTTVPEPAVRVWPDEAAACAPVDTPLRGDVDDDGCDEPVVFADGMLIADSVRLAVGGSDDMAATGDWDCDGNSTLVLLQAAASSLWHFADWPGTDEHVVGELVTRQPDAVAILAQPSTGRCDRLVVGLRDGTTVVVDVPTPEVDA